MFYQLNSPSVAFSNDLKCCEKQAAHVWTSGPITMV